MGCIPSKQQFLPKRSLPDTREKKKNDKLASPVMDSPPPWVNGYGRFVVGKDGAGRFVGKLFI